MIFHNFLDDDEEDDEEEDEDPFLEPKDEEETD